MIAFVGRWCMLCRNWKSRNPSVVVKLGSAPLPEEKKLFLETVLEFQNEWWGKTQAQQAAVASEQAADVCTDAAAVTVRPTLGIGYGITCPGRRACPAHESDFRCGGLRMRRPGLDGCGIGR